ncbi:MAG: DUF5060 domain-containing protein [Candidatus Glassbacteria bacterium]|nr:DUF5060 domain-containing protein [Candidatus Glassbacteria bacterium]
MTTLTRIFITALMLFLPVSCRVTSPPVELTVGRNGVAELAVHYSAPLANPFADIEATASFSHPQSGRSALVDGFYDGDSTWRFRFAPDEEGVWTAELSLVRDGKTVVHNRVGIECEGADQHRSAGFVRRSEQNPYRLAFEDGTPFYPVGIQPCGAAGAGLDGPLRGEGNWRTLPMDQYLDEMQGAANLFRIQLGQGTRKGCAREIMTDELGFYRYDLEVCRLLDETYRLLDARGFATILIAFQDMSLWGPDTTVFGPSKTMEGWKDRSNRELMAAIKHYLRYIVARYAVYTDIWEIFNEDVYTPDEWLEEVAGFVRERDPYDHLLTTSYERPYAEWCELVTPHLYVRVPANETGFILERQFARHKGWGKPVLYTEFGNKGTISNRDPDKWRVAVWTSFMYESAVTFWSMGGIVTLPHTDAGNANAYLGREARGYFRNFHAFSRDLPADMRPAMSGYEQGDGVARYALSNGTTGVLYLHHYAGYDTATSCGIYFWSWPGTFEIRWFDPSAGTWGGTDTVESRGNALVFGSPEFSEDLAALITRID